MFQWKTRCLVLLPVLVLQFYWVIYTFSWHISNVTNETCLYWLRTLGLKVSQMASVILVKPTHLHLSSHKAILSVNLISAEVIVKYLRILFLHSERRCQITAWSLVYKICTVIDTSVKLGWSGSTFAVYLISSCIHSDILIWFADLEMHSL